MSDPRDEDLEITVIDIEETVVTTVGGPGDDRRDGSGGPDGDVDAMSAAPDDDIRGMSAAPDDDIRGMSYEQARDALVGVVDRLERGGSTLEESLALWERGEALAARCETWLIGARARLDAARGTAPADA